MLIPDNDNFLSVYSYDRLKIDEVLKASRTSHLNKERMERLENAIKLNLVNDKATGALVQAPIDRCFLVDKGHPDGEEIHCVTTNGMIFILNERKFIKGTNSFITVLIARSNQVYRLYEECGLKVSQDILNICKIHEDAGLNV